MALQSIDLSAQGSRGQVVVLSMEFGQGGCFITASSQVNMAHWASTALPDPCSYKRGLEDIRWHVSSRTLLSDQLTQGHTAVSR